jgi:hypothetical protein
MNVSVRRFLFLLVLFVLCPFAVAQDDETDDEPAPSSPPPSLASDEAAKSALKRFDQADGGRDALKRLAAIEELASVRHPDVADRLLKVIKRERDPRVQAAILLGMAHQKEAAEDVGPTIERYVKLKAEEVAKEQRKGGPGFPLNPRTGEPDLKNPETRAAIQAMEERELVVAAGLRCLFDLPFRKRIGSESVEPLLQTACDDLVVAALEAIAKWELWDTLPAVLELHQMYPEANKWATGAVVDASGTNATAKKKWMSRFGHPGKKIPRPRVVNAIHASIGELSGETIEAPEDIEALLRDPAVKRKVKGR